MFPLFQFLYGTIKTKLLFLNLLLTKIFQFLYGTIKTLLR